MLIFDRLKETFFPSNPLQARFDPATLDDEIALKTEWKPVNNRESEYCPKIIEQISPRRMEFRARVIASRFPLLLMVIGTAAGLVMTLYGIQGNNDLKYWGIPFGSAFFLSGLSLLPVWAIPCVFDLNLGYYWKSRNKVAPIDMRDIRDRCRLKDIHAIQLLKVYYRNSLRYGNGHCVYELNLVLSDGRRLNVVDHHNQALLSGDAQKLARFLNISFWDATRQGE